MIKLNSVILTSALLLTFTACGGGSGSDDSITPEVKQESIVKISNFADNTGEAPSKEDYINAGIDENDLAYIDIEELNDLVASKDATEVDSEEELTALAQSIIDKEAPVITLNGDTVVNLLLNKSYTDAGATAIDNKDGEVPVETIENTVNTSKIGTYKVTYKAVDRFNNTAIVSRTVNVVADNIPPVITINTPSTIKEGEKLTPSATTDDGSEVTYSGATIDESTPPGKYTIAYHAVDSFENASDLTQVVEVKALTISELLTASKNGREGVTYIAVGDSTRNYPGVNDSFVTDYYPNQLDNIGVDFKNSAASGQRAYEWLDNISISPKLNYTETIAMIPTSYVEQRKYILEFSMGINDAKEKDKDEFTKVLKDSIENLQRDREYIKILLVSPVPHYIDYSLTTSDELEEVYKEVALEFQLPFVSGKDTLQYQYDNERTTYYADAVHPNAEGSKILFNKIFESVATSDIYTLLKR